MKNCKQCGEAKPLSDFHKGKTYSGGRKPVCKNCLKEYAAKYRRENADKVKQRQDDWRARNLDQQKTYKKKYFAQNVDSFYARSANRRARKLSVGGKLTSDLSSKLFQLQNGRCACCKKPLGNDYHLDHIMPLALGGTNTNDNIQLLRARCNLQKQAKHPVDFMQQRGYLL